MMQALNINHDVLTIPNGETEIIIASDNSGAIGEKEFDDVRVPYEVVAYFAFRVCYMTCLAAGATPFSAVALNFNGDEAWEKLKLGIAKGCSELSQPLLPMSGSSETNFTMQQSATGLSLVSKRTVTELIDWQPQMKAQLGIAVIGKPLVGPEVVVYGDEVASMKDFAWLSEQSAVKGLIPVGSKGIAKALDKVSEGLKATFDDSLDLEKSSGPATCYIVIFEQAFAPQLKLKISDPIYEGQFESV